MKFNFKTILSVLLIGTGLFFAESVFGYNIPDTVRVGLEYKYKEVYSVPVSNTDIIIGCQKGEDFIEEAELYGSSFVFSVPDSVVIDVNEYYPSYNKALNACDDIYDRWGYRAVPAYAEEGLWNVYVYDTSSDSTDFAANTLNGSIVSSNSIMVLKDSGKPVMYFDEINPQIEAADNGSIIKLSDRSYRGRMEFGRYSGKNITAVNVVGLEEYLYGTVPSEMPSTWDLEAIKAQTVAARSYALTRRDMNVHSASGYDLCDGTNCQVYIGYSSESETARRAVDETAGVLAYYNGQPINAVFFSSSGGSTDNAENVWNEAVPYLKAVQDLYEESPSWTRTFTADELKSIATQKGKNIGTVESIDVSVGEYGRVQELKLNGSSGSVTFSKEETRSFCSGLAEGSLLSRMYTINTQNPYTVREKVSVENSEGGTIFAVSMGGINEISANGIYAVNYSGGIESISGDIYAVTPNGTGKINVSKNTVVSAAEPAEIYSGGRVYPDNGKFVFYGAGSGHGVGMSQYGAQAMAKAGYTYKEILEHYYTDITVE